MSLNPCCAGRCSSTCFGTSPSIDGSVSILVVLDDALVLVDGKFNGIAHLSLNPCCAGRCSSTRETETILIINMSQNYAKVIFAFLNQKLTIS